MLKNDSETINDQSVTACSKKGCENPSPADFLGNYLDRMNAAEIPESYCDFWMRRLSTAANQVLMTFYLIVPKSERESLALTLSQIVMATGRSRNTISKALLELVENGLVKRVHCLREKGHDHNCYVCVFNSDAAQMEE